MPALPAPDPLSAMTDIWPTMARFPAFSPETDNPFSSSPSYSNGNQTMNRVMSDPSAIDSFKDRHNRLMSTENEKNKLIEVRIGFCCIAWLSGQLSLTDHSRTSCTASNKPKLNIRDRVLTMTEKSDTTGKARCGKLNSK
jgi:hypothetical protein